MVSIDGLADMFTAVYVGELRDWLGSSRVCDFVFLKKLTLSHHQSHCNSVNAIEFGFIGRERGIGGLESSKIEHLSEHDVRVVASNRKGEGKTVGKVRADIS